MKRPRLATAAILFVLAAPLAAQRSERAVGDEMAFARELAVRYQYIDLAESVLGTLAKERLNDKQKESLALVESQIYTEGAKREGDPKKRLEVFEKAASSFKAFFAAHPFSELLPEAERSYLGLVNNYGRALELALNEAVGEEATALRATIKSVLDDGLERTSTLKDAFDRPELSPAEKFDKWRLMLDRAQMLITLGRVTADPEFLYSQAKRELERVASEAGETSGPGLNAFLALTKLYRDRGSFDEAFSYAEYVANASVPADPTLPEWKELPPEIKGERFKLYELAMPDLIESLVAAGKTHDAANWSLKFYNVWKREGFTISPMGYLALLSGARALLDAGGYVGGSLATGNLQWFETDEEMKAGGFTARDSRSALELALKTAQDVNTENKGNTLQIRAQKLISDVISRPGVVVPPDVLYEAAMGESNSRNHAVALDSFKAVIRALDGRDDATRREYMPKVLSQIGKSLAALGRPLEAAMAYRDAATTWSGDPEFQPIAAQGFYREIGNVRRAAPGDKLIEEQFLAAEKLVTESTQGSGTEVVKWRQAERKYEQKDFDGARTIYLTVGRSADEHEKAIVKAAVCLHKKNDKDGAKKEFEHYLAVFVPDAQNAITGPKKTTAREEAMAQATYYLGWMAFVAEAWDEVVVTFEGYEEKYESQSDYAPRALQMLVTAHISKKDLAAARASVAALERTFPTNAATGKAAYSLYQALKVLQEAAKAATETERAQELTKEMAQYMRLYNRTSSEPSYSPLRVESELWLGLEDWVAAEETLRGIVQAFEGKPDHAEQIEKFVLPDLGQALLGQKRVPEAFAVLDPLVPKDDNDPRKVSSALVRNWCRAVTGWVETDGATAVEVPGVGGDFKRVNEQLEKLIGAERATNEAWSCPWYALKFEQIYALLQWSKADSAQEAAAKRMLDDIQSQLGDPDLKDIAEKCGNEDLRKQFLWLRGQLR